MIKLSNLTYRNIRILLHGLFWVSFVLTGSLILAYDKNFPFRFYLINFLVNLPVYMLYTYVSVYVLVYRFLRNKRYFFMLILFPFALFGFSVIKLLISRFVFYQFFIPVFLRPATWLSVELVLINCLWLIAPMLVFIAIKFYKDWVNSLAEKSELEKSNLETELQLLKAQLNPHFLFNTFNNLYVLALQKSDKTAEVIAKMSELFHYILYECNAPEVPLHKELKLIENYIELEQLRYSDRLNLEFDKNITDENYPVAPMILFTFVENCFKHGSSKEVGNSWIRIKIDQNKGNLSFQANNSMPKNRSDKNVKGRGLGLANIAKRMELMYPGNYKLNIKDEKTNFMVHLQIKNGAQVVKKQKMKIEA